MEVEEINDDLKIGSKNPREKSAIFVLYKFTPMLTAIFIASLCLVYFSVQNSYRLHVKIMSNVNNASFSIDNQLSIYSTNEAYLSTGTHTITSFASPFKPITCIISEPTRPSDSCLTINTSSQSSHNASLVGEKNVLFYFTFQQLPASLRNITHQQLTTIASSFSTQSTIFPGDHYGLAQLASTNIRFGGIPPIANATVPMTVSGIVKLGIFDHPSLGCDVNVCGSSISLEPYGKVKWGIFIPITTQIVVHQPLSSIPLNEVQSSVSIVLQLDNGMKWSLQNSGDENLIPIQAQVWGGACFQTYPIVYNPSSIIPSEKIVQYNAGIEGCEYRVQVGTSQPLVIAHFIWRFGAMLAVDAPAHQLMPAIPMANDNEIKQIQSKSLFTTTFP